MENVTLGHMLGPYGGIGIMGLLMIGWGLFVTIFWMICAWRAMRAHEQLAQAVKELSDRRD